MVNVIKTFSSVYTRGGRVMFVGKSENITRTSLRNDSLHRLKLSFFIIGLIWLFLPQAVCLGADYYVDNAATGNNDGSSWTNAWQSFAYISWGSVSAGDTLYISGGSDGKTYAEKLTIGASGSSGNPITIKPGAAHPALSAGHNGLVTIDASGINYGIDYDDNDYVTVNGKDGTAGVPSSPYDNINYIKMRVVNGTSRGIIGDGCSGIKVFYVYAYGNGNDDNDHSIDFDADEGSEIGYCDIEKTQKSAVHAATEENSFGGLLVHHNHMHELFVEGMVVGEGVDIYNNIIGPYQDAETEQHRDLIQMFRGYNRVYNNLFYPGGPWGGSHTMLFLNYAFGDYGQHQDHVYIYNNVFTSDGECYTGHNFRPVRIGAQGGAGYEDQDDIKIFHNTFVDTGDAPVSGGSHSEDAKWTNFEVKNNLMYNSNTDGGSPISFNEIDFANSDIDIDGNLIHEGDVGGNTISWDGTAYTVSQFNAAFGKNNVEQEPGFVAYSPGAGLNNDLHLSSGDTAARDAGADLSAFPYLGYDKDGNIRPQGSGYDIGAYEYVSSDPNNHAPVLDPIGNQSVDENSLLTFTVTATDPDGDTITYLAQNLPSDANFSGQTFSWKPSYEQQPSDDQQGDYEVTFIASDGQAQDSETITITVNNVNRPPILSAIGGQSVDENVLLSLSMNATDPDGQALTYSLSGLPAGAVFVSQTLTWTPSYDQAGAFAVTFTADDGQAQDSEAITITVINVNRAPVFTAINNQSVWADDPLTFTIDATDPDGDTVTYSTGTLPTGATFTGQDFDWTPSQGQGGSYDVTFIASDGQSQDSQMVTITVDPDSIAPTISNSLPTAGSIQAPLNNLINLNITDAGKGVDADTVTIKVNNNTVYTGDTNHYSSPDGECRRLGNKADYRFVYQSNEEFDYDQTVDVTVTATDLAGNAMSEHSYSFVTEMRSFSQNKQVNSGSVNLNSDRPVTVLDSSGNIWAAWHAGPIDNRDIYIGKLAAGAENFDSTIQITNDAADQCNPAIALRGNNKLHVVWQDNRRGTWDIYISTSSNGVNWPTKTRITDSNDNQINPAIIIDGQSPKYAHVAWQDDRAGNQDIYVATSKNYFNSKTVSQITSDSFDQVEPAITVDSANTIYVVWTDGRNGPNDIYGAASNNSWINVQIVNNANNQSSPAIAAEGAGSILHLLWADDTSGDNDIYYATSNGLLDCPLTGFSIIDDTSGADQLEPAIVVEGSTVNDLKVFACWQDWRNADTDLYFAELSAGSGTNVFVGDGGSSAYQGEPVIGIDEYDHPYLVWADSRNTDIYYAGSTFVEPVALASKLVTASAPSSTTVGADPQAITTVDDVSVVVPAGACSYDVAIKVTKIANPQAFAALCLGGYDFGPSGIQFSQPVTITIPYFVSESNGSTLPYWYNSLTGTLSQQGITDVQDIVISPTLHALSFKTMHFTAFYLLGGGGAAAALGLGGGGGGGGCSVSASGEGNIVEFFLPYFGFVVVLAILTVRDARVRKARNIAAGKSYSAHD